MTTYRLRTFMRNTAPFPLRRLSPPSPPPPAAGPAPREGDPGASGSAVYRHALRFQRPTTVRWHEQVANSASFIGSVLFPLRRVSAGDGRFGVSTLLRVHTPRDSGRGFRISLKMWDEMAEISWKHLRPEDFVYVSGQLGSYEKASEGGQIRTYYEVIVKELNYVAQTCKDQCLPTSAESKSGALSEKRKDRLQLWQIFFANPYEWWDNRTSKVNPRQPDFKHRDTGESLWLCSDDPPWIQRQLELLDSRMGGKGLPGNHFPRRISSWVYDE
ncbi:protein OSB1, mitochondrial-like isoform X2 [Syzygium oleosum]|uniref:protein OSB1, mitochondrial-like isoform X2 n=1 Tax=Syzygium oleosum TaxID=219896 RepID=UPI0011D19E50|nr:protein OSB1, mitochondrial-like isoform X2 [Syzygium oleosum]